MMFPTLVHNTKGHLATLKKTPGVRHSYIVSRNAFLRLCMHRPVKRRPLPASVFLIDPEYFLLQRFSKFRVLFCEKAAKICAKVSQGEGDTHGLK
jgi:hypothetical protein